MRKPRTMLIGMLLTTFAVQLAAVSSAEAYLSYHLRNSNTTGVGEINIANYGTNGDKPVAGDWDGDGDDTIGVVGYNGTFAMWQLRNTNTAGAPDVTYQFGLFNDQMVPGNVGCFGRDVPMVYRNGAWYIRRPNGTTDSRFFGNSSHLAVTGYAGYSGCDQLALFNNGSWKWRYHWEYQQDWEWSYGMAGDIPLLGDWNGDGLDTWGVYRPSTSQWFLNDDYNDNVADYVFYYGAPGYGHRPIVGDWDGNGTDTPGIVAPG